MINFKNKYFKVPLLYSGSGGVSILPPELQGCEWLQFDSTNYLTLHTASKARQTKITNLQLEFENNLIDNQTGAGKANNSTRFFVGTSNEGFIDIGIGTQITTTINAGYNQIYTFDLDAESDIAKVNDTIYNFGGSFVSSSIPFLIGKRNNSSGQVFTGKLHGNFEFYDNVHGDCLLYCCYIKDGNTFIDNKNVECQAGIAGLYDVTNNIFYTKDVGNDIGHGPDINI